MARAAMINIAAASISRREGEGGEAKRHLRLHARTYKTSPSKKYLREFKGIGGLTIDIIQKIKLKLKKNGTCGCARKQWIINHSGT